MYLGGEERSTGKYYDVTINVKCDGTNGSQDKNQSKDSGGTRLSRPYDTQQQVDQARRDFVPLSLGKIYFQHIKLCVQPRRLIRHAPINVLK